MADHNDPQRPSVKRMVRVTGVNAKDIVSAKGKGNQQDNTELFAPPTFYIDPIELFESRDALTAGPPGPQGVAGNTGATGSTGDTGATGPQGEQGVQGERGDTGAAGRDGYDGVTGADGAQGVRGATGDQGLQGERGDTGATGPQGDTGPQGNTIVGPKGDPGDSITGPTGAQGDPGATGATGDTGPRGTKTYYQASDPTPDEYADVQFEDFAINTVTGDFFANGAASSSTSGGVGSSTSSAPLIDDVGILVFAGYISPGDIRDFVVPGEQTNDNSDGSLTYRFKMPYAGWILGYSFTGVSDAPMQIGAYVSKKDADGNYFDVIHNDPSTLSAVNLQDFGVDYFSPAPPYFLQGELAAMKVHTAGNNGGVAGNASIRAYLHVQYDPTSVATVAMIQPA